MRTARAVWVVLAAGAGLDLETGPVRVVSDPDGFRRLVFDVTPRSAPTGAVRLQVTVDGLEAAPQDVRVQ